MQNYTIKTKDSMLNIKVELNDEEMEVVANVRKAIEARVKNGCTGGKPVL